MRASPSATTWIGIITLVQSVLIFVPMVILGNAIDWPNSLDFAPAVALPLILEQLPAVRLGYGVYLFYSVAWVAVGAGLVWVVRSDHGPLGPLAVTAIALIAVSALARAIGIIRWLTASTVLAEAYPSASPEAAQAIELIQSAVNAWGGAVGELLGVSLFAAGWLACISILFIRQRALPRWLGYAGVVAALLLAAPVVELFGYTANLFLATSALHTWLMVTGVVLVWSGTRGEAHSASTSP
ncbi:MAG: DUF4386 domain-containing protein [Pseudomonadota bacterium]